MTLHRQAVGDPVTYRGHTIQARFMGPDLLSFVDGQEMPGFYVDRQAALKGGERHVDELVKEAEKTQSRSR